MTRAARALTLATLALLAGTAAAGQETAHGYVIDVADAFIDTPSGQGLLPTAAAEAQVAIQHAELAASVSYDIGAVRRHVQHVLHALDPALAPVGPGLGYGVKRAAEGVARQIELAAEPVEASDNLRTHARHIAGAARSVVAGVGRIVALAERIEVATSASSAAGDLDALHALTRALFFGQDADGDERVGWAEPEGGLRQAQWHMRLLKRGEGLGP